MKFAIGTSQRMSKYGFLNTHLKKLEFKKIIKNNNKKIDLIDTASVYGTAEKEIGKFCNSSTKIVTKISKIKSKSIENVLKEINRKIRQSCKNLKSKNLYALLFHDEKDILFFKNTYFKKNFEQIKKKFFIKKIGYSTYNIYNIPEYQKIYKFDIVQFPLNIFSIDQKKIKFLKKIKLKYKIELHARSIFLQGLALQDPMKLTNNFKHLKNKIKLLREFCNHNKIDLYDFLISCIDNLKTINYAVIGISSIAEYKKLNQYKFISKSVYKTSLKKFYIKNQILLDPRLWKH
jgi:aryl-alcohol dehydrogenase-like predicted oxidoreductase